MVNIQWKENGKIRYENLLSESSIDDFVMKLKERGCTDIEITKDVEKVISDKIKRYNSSKRRWNLSFRRYYVKEIQI